MSWRDMTYRMLPPVGSVPPHVTSPYGAAAAEGRVPPSTIPHGGNDLNYIGGRYAPLNKSHPAIHSPVDGIVTNAGQGTVGKIAIRDKDGFSHEILHTQKQNVSIGDPVAAGRLIGTMGNTGTHDQHVHYQLKDPEGQTINPTEFWDRQGPADSNPAPPVYLGEYQQYLLVPMLTTRRNRMKRQSPMAARMFGAWCASRVQPQPLLSIWPQSQ